MTKHKAEGTQRWRSVPVAAPAREVSQSGVALQPLCTQHGLLLLHGERDGQPSTLFQVSGWAHGTQLKSECFSLQQFSYGHLRPWQSPRPRTNIKILQLPDTSDVTGHFKRQTQSSHHTTYNRVSVPTLPSRRIFPTSNRNKGRRQHLGPLSFQSHSP